MIKDSSTDRPVILVVEDDATMRKAITAALTSQGYQVVAAPDAEEALKIAGQQSFDLVVTDVRMGALNGLDALEQTKRMQPGIGSLVVSGYTSEAETLRAVELSVDGYLKKPFRVAELLARVDSILGEKRKKALHQGQVDLLRRALWSCCNGIVELADQIGKPLSEGELARRSAWLSKAAKDLQLPPDSLSQIALGVELRLLQPAPWLQDEALLEGLRTFPILHRIVTQGSFSETEGPENQLVHQALDGSFAVSGDSAGAARLTSTAPTTPQEKKRGGEEGLLVLAQALERGGDISNARRAYLEALGLATERRQRVQILLGLARLAQQEGETDSLATLCREAVDNSQELNFGSQAHVCQEAALLMASQGEKVVAQRLMERAATLFRGLEMAGEEAFSLIVTAILGQREIPEEHVETLLGPEYSTRLRGLADAFLANLLTGVRNPQLLSRLIGRVHLAAQQQLQVLPVEARLALAERASALQQMGAQELVRLLQGDPDNLVRARTQVGKAEAGSTQASTCELRTFGMLEIFVGQEKISEQKLKASKVKFMLAYLAAHGSVSEDLLMDLFWGDQSNPRACLHKAVSTLRSALEPRLSGPILLREAGRMQISPAIELWHDLSEFRESVAVPVTAPEAWHQLRRALVLYRGPYLDGCYFNWAVLLRGELEAKAAQASFQVAQLAVARNVPQLALEYSLRCLELDPMRQDALLLALKNHVSLGRPAAAVSLYEKHCARLQREYGVEPTTELLREYHAAKLGIT